ncbi:hypothetical protein [Spiroplasma endosymbiont of Stenodema calcarata]|uniref:hypothetical protein n=1 Tax=Spiroplasma endosymbiont of Stenodema calcarata TaxID=3139328 RepID=UPI003CCA801B
MKNLLSLLGTFLLTTSGTITVMSCTPKASKDNSDGQDEMNDSFRDIEIINKISQKVRENFENLSFKEDIERNNAYMSVAYTRVSDKNKTYELDDKNKDDLAIKNEFLSTFRAVFDNVNREIKNEYSNYYINSDPISFKESDVKIDLTFIDIKQLITLSKLPDIGDLQAVGINFSVQYDVKFKDLVSPNKYYAGFNMASNLTKFNLVKGATLNYFKENIVDFFKDKSQIDITTGDFKKLYDAFNIDYKRDIYAIDNIYKTKLTSFIQGNANLKDMITYNKNQNFLANQTILFDSDYDRGFYYNGYGDASGPSLLSKWVKDNNINKAQAADFVSLYIKSVVPKLDAELNLELGKFKFSLDYINIYVLKLSDYFKTNDNVDFISTVILTRDKLEAKITNFANIIIAFLKYYKVNFNGKNHFNVSDNVWNELVKRYLEDKLTNYTLPVILFKHFINDENVIKQNLADLDLLNFKQVTGWASRQLDYDKNNNLFWFNGGYDATFTFGSSQFYYTPFYYLWSDYKFDVLKG